MQQKHATVGQAVAVVVVVVMVVVVEVAVAVVVIEQVELLIVVVEVAVVVQVDVFGTQMQALFYISFLTALKIRRRSRNSRRSPSEDKSK